MRDGSDYRLSDDLQGLADDERAELIALCEAKLAAFLERRGLGPWEHRLLQALRGSIRERDRSVRGFNEGSTAVPLPVRRCSTSMRT